MEKFLQIKCIDITEIEDGKKFDTTKNKCKI